MIWDLDCLTSKPALNKNMFENTSPNLIIWGDPVNFGHTLPYGLFGSPHLFARFTRNPFCSGANVASEKQHNQDLKDLGHAILGNFSSDQIVIELTKASKYRLKTIEELLQSTGKQRRDMGRRNWKGLKLIAFR